MKTISLISRISLRTSMVILTGLISSQFLSAQWYNPYWQYRVPVTIRNYTGSTLTQHQVQVQLDGLFTWSNALNGGSDIRITDSDGQTDIPFWIEKWNSGTSASIWVKVPEVADGITNNAIYIYYGNIAAPSLSNGFSTFEFFDDFEGGTINVFRWTPEGGSWSVIPASQQNGITGNVAQGYAYPDSRALLKSSFTGTDYILEGYGQQTGPSASRLWGFGIRSFSLNHTYLLKLFETFDNNPDEGNLRLYRWDSDWDDVLISHANLGVINRNIWYKLKIKAHDTTFDFYFDNEPEPQATVTDATYPSGSVGLYGEEPGSALYDDVFVRKYAETDPSSDFGSQELNPNSPLTVSLESKNDISCNGGNNGAINISVSGGSGSYSYLWTPGGANSQNISGLAAGTYYVMVDDNNNERVGSLFVTITQPDPLEVGYAITSPLLCYSGTATILITATGGTAPYPNGIGSYQQTAGTTLYNVTDSHGCMADVSVTVDAAGSWYNPAWQYRKQVDIPNGVSNLTNFQIKVTLGNTFDFNKSNDDGSDIRFTSSDGVTPIPFWIEAWQKTNEHATVWIKVPSIPTAGTTVYMYYGNESASDASDGNSTFEFFDDFEITTTQNGYYAFGSPRTILDEHQAWEGPESPHTLSVVRAPTGANYTYYGYYGLNGYHGIGMAGSNDLTTWTKFPESGLGPNNPLFNDPGYLLRNRWPSVILAGDVYFMVHTTNFSTGTSPSYLVYHTSSDGLAWSEPIPIVAQEPGRPNQNPNLFHDPVSGNFYLYWYRGGEGWQIMCRTASSVAGLVDAPNLELVSSNEVLAAPNIIYIDGIYFLSTEIYEDNIWKTRMYAGTSPVGPFYLLPGNPVLDNGCACLFQTLINNHIYEYYCKESSPGGLWSLEMRVIDPAAGRVGYNEGVIDKTKWIPYAGDWRVTSALQQDGTTGAIAQGNLGSHSILKSVYSGSDYIFEGYGRQIAGNIWGLGFRSANDRNTYTINLTENLDVGENLQFYDWSGGQSSTVTAAAAGIIDMNTWYKMTIKAHGSNFDTYINDVQRISNVTSLSYSLGSVALYGENGTTAQFNNVRVRKYIANDLSGSASAPEEIWAPSHQWIGSVSNDWNNALNWCGGVPTATTDVVINNPLPTPQPLLSSLITECNNLLINDGSTVTIPEGTALTVKGSLGLFNGSSLLIESTSVSSSGSLIVEGTSNGNVTYSRFMPTGTAWHYVSSPVQNPVLLPASGLSFFPWNEVVGDWGNPTTSLTSGKGYTLQTTGNTVSFTGSVISSTFFKVTSPYFTDYSSGTLEEYNTRIARNSFGGGGWNLLGNPFTSAMKVADFLDANDGDGSFSTNKFDPNYVAVYIYDGNNYFYRGKSTGFIDPVEEEDPANQMFNFDNIQAGQGFFVLAMKDEVTFTFDKGMQTHGTGTTMLKSAKVEGNSWPGLRLKVKYGDKENSTLVVYNDNMTTGLDPGYDLGLLSAGPEVEIYTTLVEKDNNVNFAQQALPLTDCDKVFIPVGIDAAIGGEVTFSAYGVPIKNYKFWLEDRELGILTDLLTNTYTVTIPKNTYGTGRFYLKAAATITSIEESREENPINGMRIWTSNGKLVIKGDVSGKAICEVYSIQGVRLLETRLNDGEINIVEMPSNSHGVFLVRVNDGSKVTTRKVVLL